jgi:RNA polymerase sigma factor (sigma-70 family)
VKFFLILSFLHETINIMTIGGLALAVGILVDDATVVIENINRILEESHEINIKQAVLDGSQQVAVPALVSTLCICIVFMPLFLLSGVARYLFVPLAEAVVFAMLASYFFSRTLVPTLAMYMLKLNEGEGESRNPLVLFQRRFERGFSRVRDGHERLLTRLGARRKVFIPAFLAVCVCVFPLTPWLGQDFFPDTDSGQFSLHIRAKTGTRIEDSAQLADLVEAAIRKEVPPNEIDSILDNIGLPFSPYNLMHSTSGVLGANDTDVLVSLRKDHHPTAQYIRALRQKLPREFPGTTFYFLPADINSALMILRRRRVRPEALTDEPIGESARPLLWEIADRRPNPEQFCIQSENHRRLQSAISKLPTVYRRVFEIRLRSEGSMKEIAEEVGITIAATKSRLLRARNALHNSIA